MNGCDAVSNMQRESTKVGTKRKRGILVPENLVGANKYDTESLLTESFEEQQRPYSGVGTKYSSGGGLGLALVVEASV